MDIVTYGWVNFSLHIPPHVMTIMALCLAILVGNVRLRFYQVTRDEYGEY